MSSQPVAAEQDKPAGHRDRLVWLMFVLGYYVGFVVAGLGVYLPLVRRDLDLSFTLQSLHLSVFAVGGLTASLVGISLARRVGRPRAIWGSAAGFGAAVAMLLLSPAVSGTLAGVYMIGVFGTVLLILAQTTLAEFPVHQRVVLITELNVVLSMAGVTASISIGLAETAGLGWRFAIGGMVSLAAVVAVRLRRASIPLGVAPTGSHGERRTLPRKFWLITVLVGMNSVVEWGIGAWAINFMQERVGFSAATAATVMSAYGITYLCSRLVASRLVRHYNPEVLVLGSFALGLVGFPILWTASNPVQCVVGLVVVAAGMANMYPFMFAISMRHAVGQLDVATARQGIIGGIATLSSPLMFGAVSDRSGIIVAFGLIMPLMAITAGYAFALLRHDLRKLPAPAANT